MLRLLVVVCAYMGAAYLLGQYFPALFGIAFVVEGIGISWLMLGSVAVGYIAYKITR